MTQAHCAVLGGGNGALMMAGHLTLLGHRVNLVEHPGLGSCAGPVFSSGRIVVDGIGPTGVAEPNLATTNFAEGLQDVGWLHVVMSSQGHDSFFEAMVPHLRPGQKVVIWTGNLSSLRLLRLLTEAGKAGDISIYETNTLPYGTRISGPGKVELLLWASRVLIAAAPGQSDLHSLEELKEAFPQLEQASSVLSVALSNPNPTVHPVASLLNTGRVEDRCHDFHLYREGITSAVATAIEHVYGETVAVAHAYGASVVQYERRQFRTRTSVMGVEFQAPFDTEGVIAGIKGPVSLADRYIQEDVPFGLVPRVELGRKAGICTPTMDAVITLSSVVTGQDFRQYGRTLDQLGVAQLSVSEIASYIGTSQPAAHVGSAPEAG